MDNPLELSEVLGAIDKAYHELGDGIYDKRLSMPLISRLVVEEERKHRKKNVHNLFKEYQQFLKDLE